MHRLDVVWFSGRESESNRNPWIVAVKPRMDAGSTPQNSDRIAKVDRPIDVSPQVRESTGPQVGRVLCRYRETLFSTGRMRNGANLRDSISLDAISLALSSSCEIASSTGGMI